jgi:hypothetical protein
MTDVMLDKMPTSVRKQFERAQELMKGDQPAEPPEGGNVPPDGAQTPPEADPAPPEAPAAPAGDDENTRSWKQKYNTLIGKYNAEVPRLHEELRGLKNQVHTLTEALNAVKSTPPEPQGAFKELIDMFGQDDPQIKFAREAQDEIFRLRAEVERLTHSLGSVAENQMRSAEDNFFATLDRIDPDWQQTNVDPELILWLQEYDPLMGSTRKEAFDRAAGNLDAQRVAAFFKEFKRQTAKPQAPQQPVKPKVSDRLASQVTPTPAGAGGGYGKDENVWTREAVNSFFRDVAKGAFRGREAEQERLQREILAAAAKGQIVG